MLTMTQELDNTDPINQNVFIQIAEGNKSNHNNLFSHVLCLQLEPYSDLFNSIKSVDSVNYVNIVNSVNSVNHVNSVSSVSSL